MSIRLKAEFDDIVYNIISHIPKETIINGRILDPAIGGGQFVRAIEQIKREAGKTDNEIKETVFGFEETSLRLNYAKNKNNLIGTYILGDFLKERTNMKFDVIIGNPPFQESKEDGKRKSLSTNLWSKFIDKSVNELLKDGGHLAMITPASWAGPTKNLIGRRRILKDILGKNKTYYINLNKKLNSYFKDVGSTFSYFVLEKSAYDHNTLVELDNNETININLNDYDSLPRVNHPLAYSISRKYSNKVKGNVIKGQLQSSFIKYQEEETSEFKFPAYHTPAQGGRIWFTNTKHPNFHDDKVIISLSGKYEPYLDKGSIGFTDMCLAYIVKKDETVESAYSVINSKLFHFVMACNKWSGFNNKEVIRTFALPNLDKVYTDDEIYDYFNLTTEERDFVNSYAPNNEDN